MSLQSGTFKKAYFEITNVCNAACTFCPGTFREAHFVSDNEFDSVISALRGRVEYLYFHLMGEPLLHPSVKEFALKAKNSGFKVMITSNGILSREVGIPLVKTDVLTKISLSLHSFEANSFGMSLDSYLEACLDLAEEAGRHDTVCALRLWNRGAEDNKLNNDILSALKKRFGSDWSEIRTGHKLANNIFIEYGDRFEWPNDDISGEKTVFCHALRNQIGILCDGTVVPCCLDAEGRVSLGSIYKSTLDDILSSPRAKALYDGFSSHKAVERMCQGCGYAKRFN